MVTLDRPKPPRYPATSYQRSQILAELNKAVPRCLAMKSYSVPKQNKSKDNRSLSLRGFVAKIRHPTNLQTLSRTDQQVAADFRRTFQRNTTPHEPLDVFTSVKVID